ncbi:hypothetical protein K437DRAFT_292669 [Tilletiaria anomala UBC 951]|uniref:Uncharacterized protein n=1 Tax=Tilletiaria anomala (strain ATCC 24038 / CBS 436.72 / UBC 951) TaxID=1037660 RepID=A0A066WGA0_TILAU|nr:uncharacterized protein K437DRAFT_292669 [Tilletiaria anomala UBC 951]KDN52997.1 hypothetical protein K437DRAFT_292669 [Tilletiaria anomala UBC 951]
MCMLLLHPVPRAPLPEDAEQLMIVPRDQRARSNAKVIKKCIAPLHGFGKLWLRQFERSSDKHPCIEEESSRVGRRPPAACREYGKLLGRLVLGHVTCLPRAFATAAGVRSPGDASLWAVLALGRCVASRKHEGLRMNELHSTRFPRMSWREAGRRQDVGDWVGGHVKHDSFCSASFLPDNLTSSSAYVTMLMWEFHGAKPREADRRVRTKAATEGLGVSWKGKKRCEEERISRPAGVHRGLHHVEAVYSHLTSTGCAETATAIRKAATTAKENFMLKMDRRLGMMTSGLADGEYTFGWTCGCTELSSNNILQATQTAAPCWEVHHLKGTSPLPKARYAYICTAGEYSCACPGRVKEWPAGLVWLGLCTYVRTQEAGRFGSARLRETRLQCLGFWISAGTGQGTEHVDRPEGGRGRALG